MPGGRILLWEGGSEEDQKRGGGGYCKDLGGGVLLTCQNADWGVAIFFFGGGL